MSTGKTLNEARERLAKLLNEEILPQVLKPGRYTDRELNAVHKDWDQVRVRVALGYPDAYEIGMANLGIQIFYDILNGRDDVLAERFYAPWPDLAEKLRAHQLPLFSLESWTPLDRFDLICLTLPSELNFTNVIEVLDLAGIPLESGQRTAEHPIVLGGGPVTANPEPIAELFDALVIGEGEEALPEIVDKIRESKGGDRQKLLRELAQIPGVYVPSLYQAEYGPDGRLTAIKAQGGAPSRVVKRFIKDLDKAPLPVKPIVPFLEVIHQRVGLEIMRGCPHQCRFCQAKTFYHPLRFRSLETLCQAAEDSLKNTGYDEISLLSLSSTNHPQIEELTQTLARRYAAKRVSIALPSSRADSFSVALAVSTQQVRPTGITLAPEVGSQRLRDIIGKKISQDEVREAARTAFLKGVSSLKLYFMIGLPGETAADLDALVDLVLEIYRIGEEARGRRFNLTVNLSPFVPKPGTPFQWAAQEPAEVLEAKLAGLKKRLKRRGVTLRWGEAGMSLLEGILARGDRRLARVIIRAWRSGAKFDAWLEFFKWPLWQEALAAEKLDPAFYTRARELDEILPWDHLDLGLSKEHLAKEYDRALRSGTENGEIVP